MLRFVCPWAMLMLANGLDDALPDNDECSVGECALNALQRKAQGTSTCQDAVPGDECYKNIMWAKHTGIKQHPHWYPGLTSHSSNADFQEIVHAHSPNKCGVPCAKTQGCHTALPGESCYKDVMWAKTHGIREHPHWYHGLSSSSTNEDFQADVHAKRPDKCPMPCTAQSSPPEVAPEPPVVEEPLPTTVPPTTATTTQAAAEVVEPVIPIIPDEEPEDEEPETTRRPQHHQQQQPHPQPQTHTPSPCPQHDQHEREACFQAIIRKEQLDREQREREEREQEQHRTENMPLDERQREIISEIGGVPTEDSLPDFDDFDPDA